MNYRKIIFWVVGAILLLGCEEQISWPLQVKTNDMIVVEAVLTNENKNHLIKLTRSYDLQNLTPEPVSGAIISINDTLSATENPPGSGLYFTDSLQAVVDKNYFLEILYNDTTYTAVATQPSGEPLDQLLYSNLENGNYTLEFRNSGDSANYIKYYIDWQNTSDCQVAQDCQAKLIYYDLKNVDVHERFKPDYERVEFPPGTTIIRRKYSVSRNYAEYLRGLLSETFWRGGIFDVAPANAVSNLSEGAVGFFAVSTVVSDTTIIADRP